MASLRWSALYSDTYSRILPRTCGRDLPNAIVSVGSSGCGGSHRSGITVELARRQCRWLAADAATGASGGEAVHGAFDDHLPVVLGEEVEHQPPAGGGGIDALFQDDEVDLMGAEPADEFQQVSVS